MSKVTVGFLIDAPVRDRNETMVPKNVQIVTMRGESAEFANIKLCLVYKLRDAIKNGLDKASDATRYG